MIAAPRRRSRAAGARARARAGGAPPGAPGRPGAAARRGRPGAGAVAEALLWALVLVPPFLVFPRIADSFDLPKRLISEVLALASLLPLAWRLRAAGSVTFAAVWRLPAVRAALPAAAVATLGLAFTAHPAHTRDALADLWIGVACLIAWSAGLEPARVRRLLAGLIVPASALALLAALQFHGFNPFVFGAGAESARLELTSLAGNTGVLAAYLVLPALVAQWLLRRAWLRLRAPGGGSKRGAAFGLGALAVALALCLYALVLTQTMTALAALGAGSVALWLAVLPRRRVLAALGAVALLAGLAVGLVPPLRAKVARAAEAVAAGNWSSALQGRTAGWRTAAWMAARQPLTGVGHGAYAAEFAPARLEMAERGARLPGAGRRMFANAHNEFLEVAAEWGLPGLAALLWGLWVLAGRLRRGLVGGMPRDDAALAVAGVLALALLATAHFPFRLGLVAFPALLLLARALAPEPAEGAKGVEVGAGKEGGRWFAWAATALVVLALAGQCVRTDRRLEAARILRQVEQISVAAAGRAPATLYWANLKLLERAHRLYPADSRIPLAAGGQYLLLGRTDEAIEAYREALAVAPRAEIYLNLGRAHAIAGDVEEARENFGRAVLLDRRLRPAVPLDYQRF